MPTYTNLIILQGWLEVKSLQSVIVNRMPEVVINGWIWTTDYDGMEKVFDEQHPVVISGRPAEAVLGITRKLNDKYPRLTGIYLLHLSGELTDQPQILVSEGAALRYRSGQATDTRWAIPRGYQAYLVPRIALGGVGCA